WISDTRLEPWKIAEGRAPANAQEVVIDRRSAKDAGYHVGDRVPIITQIAAAPIRFRLSGIARFGHVDSPLGATGALFVRAEAQRLALLDKSPTRPVASFESIVVSAQPGVTQADLKQRLGHALAVSGVEVLTGDQFRKERQNAIHKQLKFINIALAIFAGV